MKNHTAIQNLFRGNNKAFAQQLLDIVNGLDAYWPLTVRQVFYQAVKDGYIQNNVNEYRKVSRNLTKLRRLDILPWHTITDRTRRVIDKRGYTDLEEHIREYSYALFNGYERCLVQNQEYYIELFTEKDALAQIFENAAWPYCVRVVICRGQLSATFVKGYAERAWSAIRNGQRPVILYFGDLDPSGWAIPRSISSNLIEHHDLGIKLIRTALNPDQIIGFNLPHKFDAIKKTDPNYKRYFKVHGNTAVELDALHPADLTQIIENVLRQHLDLEDMDCQRGVEADERKKLKRLERAFQRSAFQEGIELY